MKTEKKNMSRLSNKKTSKNKATKPKKENKKTTNKPTKKVVKKAVIKKPKKAVKKAVIKKPKKVVKKVIIKKPAPKKKETKIIEVASPEVVENKTPVNNDKEVVDLVKKNKIYWTEDTEAAVVEFLTHDFNYYNVQIEKYIEECIKEKTAIDDVYVDTLKKLSEEMSTPEVIAYKDKVFRDRIQKSLNKLVENIIFSFKLFRSGVDIKTLHNDCLSFVYGKFANFNPDKNTKSFSYFGTVAKHYLQGEKKELDKSIQINLDYDGHRDEADSVDSFELHDKSELETSYTLFKHVINSIEKELDKGNLSENDMKVGDAIIQIFRNHEILGAYNKNHVYQLIKENTGLLTKDITYSLSRFRIFYRLLKQDFVKKDDD